MIRRAWQLRGAQKTIVTHQETWVSNNLEQRFIFQIGTLNPHGINERFSFN